VRGYVIEGRLLYRSVEAFMNALPLVQRQKR